MHEIGAYEAKTHLPKLLEQVENFATSLRGAACA